MINSQEIIERSFYSAILNTAVKLKCSLDPEDYYPISIENQQQFEADKEALDKFVYVFGTGNNQSKDQEITPRIVVNARGFYPGNVGLPHYLIEEREGIGFTAAEESYSTLDQYIDIHLVANNQEDLRLLHQLVFWSIPQRGYLKPYNVDSFLFSGNIFLELVNFFDYPQLDVGILQKVYQFEVSDTLVGKPDEDDIIVPPIKDITVLLEDFKLLNIKS